MENNRNDDAEENDDDDSSNMSDLRYQRMLKDYGKILEDVKNEDFSTVKVPVDKTNEEIGNENDQVTK